jgi:hypothetical protein
MGGIVEVGTSQKLPGAPSPGVVSKFLEVVREVAAAPTGVDSLKASDKVRSGRGLINRNDCCPGPEKAQPLFRFADLPGVVN